MRNRLTKLLASGLAAMALVAAPSGAQAQATFSYFTTGFFSSALPTCNQVAAGTSVSCEAPGITDLTLTYTGAPTRAYLDGSQVQLGTFSPSGTGDITLGATDVFFTLVINQLAPTAGTASAGGYITGRLMQGSAGFSSLIWAPTEQLLTIGPVNYNLVFDQGTNGIRIAASLPTTIKADATVTPEPVSMALLGTGLAGVVGLRRRRKSPGSPA